MLNCPKEFQSSRPFENKRHMAEFKRGSCEMRVVVHCQKRKSYFRNSFLDSSRSIKPVQKRHR